MIETHSPLYAGPHAYDPVVSGVAQGLSQLFPPVAHPDGLFDDDTAQPETEGAEGAP